MDELIICEHDNRAEQCKACKKMRQLEIKRNLQNDKLRSLSDGVSVSALQIHRLKCRLGLIRAQN